MNVPSIYDLAKSAYDDLKSKEQLLKDLEKDPLNSYIVFTLKDEIEGLKVVLSKFKYRLRDQKLNDLGI
jgi:hypothetical protein